MQAFKNTVYLKPLSRRQKLEFIFPIIIEMLSVCMRNVLENYCYIVM